MKLVISTVSRLPIYEQMENQIREKILTGELLPGELLPSIRELARECQVGVITSKRAYDDLCAEGLLISRPGKGVYVSSVDSDYIRSVRLSQMTARMKELTDFSRSAGLTEEEMQEALWECWREV
ncbi:MAG: GntR family transcriptional regulator [Lachnospiraceae bacterium]|nr:GntR family transcriptional regulator [Lachnospiraceae bacterium]MBR4208752.1 GntR family transcriptional regulator [Lachnospiraceae bacterium]MBR4250346.1 GntR family transcriptional regulator [Verrucomicrobiota bacterium]